MNEFIVLVKADLATNTNDPEVVAEGMLSLRRRLIWDTGLYR